MPMSINWYFHYS